MPAHSNYEPSERMSDVACVSPMSRRAELRREGRRVMDSTTRCNGVCGRGILDTIGVLSVFVLVIVYDTACSVV